MLHLIIVLLLVLQNHGRGGGADLQDDQGHPAHSQRWICFDNETEAEPSSQNLTVPVGTVDIPYIRPGHCAKIQVNSSVSAIVPNFFKAITNAEDVEKHISFNASLFKIKIRVDCLEHNGLYKLIYQ